MTAQPLILYVEDNPTNFSLIRRLLMVEGFIVQGAQTAPNAIEYLTQQTPDLILMDINLPRIDGYSLTKQIKAIPGCAHIPIIALTANVLRSDCEKSFASGCCGYIQKPVDVDSFSTEIRFYLNQS